MKPQKNTLMIVFDDMALGGIQIKILDLVNEITRKHPKTKIIVCLRYKKGFFLKKVPKNIKLISPTFHTNRFDMFWFIFWLTFQTLKFDPQTILSFMDLGSIPSIVAKEILFWKKIKVIVGEDILTSKYVYIESFPKIRLRLIKYLYPRVHKILVQTPVQKKDLHQIIGNSKNILVSPNWLPLNFSPQRKILKKEIDILFMGRIEAQKNLLKFIRIIKIVTGSYPQLKVAIVGQGTELPKIKNTIKILKLNKNITIFPPTINPIDFYTKSRIFLLTSDYEGFPLTLLEAIFCGCHPIINNIPEIHEFFKEDCNSIFFNNEAEAAKLIMLKLKKTDISLIEHYQRKIYKLQQKNISLFIKNIFS